MFKFILKTVIFLKIYLIKWLKRVNESDIFGQVWKEPEVMFSASRQPYRTEENKSNHNQCEEKDQKSSGRHREIVNAGPELWRPKWKETNDDCTDYD
jgi:hypothetical protein